MKKNREDFSEVKAKKYETLIVQIWELLPIFLRQNSSKLASAFSSLLPHLETMVNQNTFGLRSIALRSFSQIIDFCRNCPQVTEQVKTTRKGLQRICMPYVKGLSSLYCGQKQQTSAGGAASGEVDVDRAQVMTDAERRQVLVTLRDFSSVAKTGTLNNLFLVTFAELVDRKTNNSVTQTETMLQLDVLIAILDKVKLKRENYLTLMQHVKIFVSDRST